MLREPCSTLSAYIRTEHGVPPVLVVASIEVETIAISLAYFGQSPSAFDNDVARDRGSMYDWDTLVLPHSTGLTHDANKHISQLNRSPNRSSVFDAFLYHDDPYTPKSLLRRRDSEALSARARVTARPDCEIAITESGVELTSSSSCVTENAHLCHPDFKMYVVLGTLRYMQTNSDQTGLRACKTFDKQNERKGPD